MGDGVKTFLRSPVTVVIAATIVVAIAVALAIDQTAGSNDDPEDVASELTDTEPAGDRQSTTDPPDYASDGSDTTSRNKTSPTNETTSTGSAPGTSAAATSHTTLSTAPQTQIPRESLAPGGGGSAATDLEAASECDPDRGVIAQLSWSLASQPGDAQQVALTQFADGFETGRFSLSDKLPASAALYTWSAGLEPGITYRWEVLTRHGDVYTRSDTATFRGADCFADS